MKIRICAITGRVHLSSAVIMKKTSTFCFKKTPTIQTDPMVAAHLRTFLKACGSFAHTIFPGKRFHLRTLFHQVNVTFAHIKFSPVNGMFVLAGLYRQAK